MMLEGQNGEVCKADHFTQRGRHVRMIPDLMFWNYNDLGSRFFLIFFFLMYNYVEPSSPKSVMHALREFWLSGCLLSK